MYPTLDFSIKRGQIEQNKSYYGMRQINYKTRQLFYYKIRRLYCKMRQLLQNASIITKRGSTDNEIF